MSDKWIDNQGDIWVLGADGLMHTPETAPFPREYVEKKWGPLKPLDEALATPYPEQETTKVEERPDDDPAPVATCNGRDCGGRPHE